MLPRETTNGPEQFSHDPEVTLAHDLTEKRINTIAGNPATSRHDPTGGASVARHRMRSRSVPDAASGQPSQSPSVKDLNGSPSPELQYRDSVSTEHILFSKTRSRSEFHGSDAPRSPSTDPGLLNAGPTQPNSTHDVKSEGPGQPESCQQIMASQRHAASHLIKAQDPVLARHPHTQCTVQRQQPVSRIQSNPKATAKRKHASSQAQALAQDLHQQPGITDLQPDIATGRGQDRSFSMSEADEDNSDGDEMHGHKRLRFQGVHRPLWSAWCDAYAELPDLDGDSSQARSASVCCWHQREHSNMHALWRAELSRRRNCICHIKHYVSCAVQPSNGLIRHPLTCVHRRLGGSWHDVVPAAD